MHFLVGNPFDIKKRKKKSQSVITSSRAAVCVSLFSHCCCCCITSAPSAHGAAPDFTECSALCTQHRLGAYTPTTCFCVVLYRRSCSGTSMLNIGWGYQQQLLCGGTATSGGACSTSFISSSFTPSVNSMMAMMRRPPVRCQALADSMLASARAGMGLAMTQRDLGASRQCGDIPTETLSLDDDYVVINKVSSVRGSLSFTAVRV